MRVRYDLEVDVLRVLLDGAVIVESDEDEPGTILDYDKEGKVVGLEILDAIGLQTKSSKMRRPS